MNPLNKIESGQKLLSFRPDGDDGSKLFDAAMLFATAARKVVSTSSILKLFVKYSLKIFFAKNRDEAHAAADELFELNPDHKKGSKHAS